MRERELDRRIWRSFTPPRPVLVDMSRALPLARRAHPADRVPMWLRTVGVRLEGLERGEQLAWIRLTDGQWLAKVRVFPSVDRDRTLAMTLWVTQDAILDRDD